jgi:hypothetical protein
MAYIDKLLKKFQKAKNAINSIKGIASQIQAINFESALDELGEAKDKASEVLDRRRTSLKNSLNYDGAKGKSYSKRLPDGSEPQIIYPIHDKLANYLVFDIRPRRARGSSQFSDKSRSIALYVPDQIISQATVQYTQTGVNAFTRGLERISNALMSPEKDLMDVGAEEGKKMANAFVKDTLNKMTGGLTNLRAGRAVNPQNEQILDGVPFRSWDFTYDFYPRSQDEAKNVLKIIETFRMAMLPDTYSDVSILGGEEVIRPEDNPNANFFNYPNIFDIYFDGPMGNKVDGFLPAVCSNAQVDYTGGQKFSTFEDGMPVHIQLTLQFLEIKILTQGNYQAIKAESQDFRFEHEYGVSDSIFERAAISDVDPDD